MDSYDVPWARIALEHRTCARLLMKSRLANAKWVGDCSAQQNWSRVTLPELPTCDQLLLILWAKKEEPLERLLSWGQSVVDSQRFHQFVFSSLPAGREYEAS